MLKYKIIIVLVLQSFCMLGQNHKSINLLTADSTWGKEIIEFPLHFAPQLNYKGVEDVRFPFGWENVDHPYFWSCIFVWDITLNKTLRTQEVEEHIQTYLDGLMAVVNEDDTIDIPKTKAHFKKKVRFKTPKVYKGTIDVYDAFITKKMITLNVTVEGYYCISEKKSNLLFRVSPQNFRHTVWDALNQITIRDRK